MNPFGSKLHVPFPTEVDAYQAGMYNQIPSGMENFQCSQLTHRKALLPNENRIVSAGLALFIEWLDNVRVTQSDIERAEEFYSTFCASVRPPFSKPYPWPKEIFQTIVDKYNGKIPINVSGLIDGSAHYVGEPSVQVWTDEPGMGEMVGWIESELLPYMWQCSVVATRGRIRKERFHNIYKGLYPQMSDDDIKMLYLYKFHDFGRRGAANSLVTGYAHLINWPGTDTVDAAYFIQTYLNGGRPFGACSIPAMAHRTVTPWPSEFDAYDNMIDLYGDDLVSIVADSYDYNTGATYLANQANKIQKKGGVLVIRPDSGDPIECILYGLNALNERFGSSKNSAELKVLNGAAIIQGDGVSDEDIFDRIIPAVIANGYCPSNVAFGMGQHNHKAQRGDLESAYKTCMVGDSISVMKASNSQHKMSFPCPVKIITRVNEPRVQPASIKDLKMENTGDLISFYGQIEANTYGKLQILSFDKTLEIAHKSWNRLQSEGPEGNSNIDPYILNLQKEYMESH